MSTQRLIVGNSGTQNINLATANVIGLDATTSVNVSSIVRASASTAAAPSYSFTSDTNSGVFSIGDDVLGVVTGGVTRISVNNGNNQFTNPILLPDGSAAAPVVSFNNDSNTGIYSGGADVLAISTGGTNRVSVSSTTLTTTIPIQTTTIQATSIQTAAGSAAAPSHSFTGDTDTGIYSGGANVLAVAVGGTNTVNHTTTSITPATDNTISLGTDALSYANGIYSGVLLSKNRGRFLFNMMASSASTAVTGAVAYAAGQTQYPTSTLASTSNPINTPPGTWAAFGNAGSNFYISYTNDQPYTRYIFITWSLMVQISVNLGFYAPFLYRSTTAPPFGVAPTFTQLWDNTQDPQLIKVVGAHQNNDRASHNLCGIMSIPASSTLWIPLAIANSTTPQNITLFSMNGSAYVID